MILGVDLWQGYGKIDFGKARAAGVRFAFAQCTKGNDPTGDDARFAEYVAGAQAAGIIVGAYHFHYGLPWGPKFPAGRSGAEQAKRFWGKCGALGSAAGTLPPILDLEWPAHFVKASDGKLNDLWLHWGTNPDIIVDNALDWLSTIETLSGRTPMVYTYPDDAKNLASAKNFAELGKYGLGIASYMSAHAGDGPPADDASPPAVTPWDDWTIWQFAADNSHARIDGIPACPLDRDCVRSLDALAALAGLDSLTE